MYEYKFEIKKSIFGGIVYFQRLGKIGIIGFGEVGFQYDKVICTIPSWFTLIGGRGNSFAGTAGSTSIEISVYERGVIGYGNITGVSAIATFILN